MLVETIRRIAPCGRLSADVGGVDAGPVLELERREVDVLDLDLARLDVGDASVVGHDPLPG